MPVRITFQTPKIPSENYIYLICDLVDVTIKKDIKFLVYKPIFKFCKHRKRYFSKSFINDFTLSYFKLET